MNDAFAPREHAIAAAAMLRSLSTLASRVEEADEYQRLEWAASGVMRQINADQHWTAELAIANALTAIALVLTSDLVVADDR